MGDTLHDDAPSRRLIARRAVWRDAGGWKRLATVWRPDAARLATLPAAKTTTTTTMTTPARRRSLPLTRAHSKTEGDTP